MSVAGKRVTVEESICSCCWLGDMYVGVYTGPSGSVSPLQKRVVLKNFVTARGHHGTHEKINLLAVVGTSNKAVIDLLEQLGFETIKTFPSGYGGYNLALMFRPAGPAPAWVYEELEEAKPATPPLQR
jgi:hypothetical protein